MKITETNINLQIPYLIRTLDSTAYKEIYKFIQLQVYFCCSELKGENS